MALDELYYWLVLATFGAWVLACAWGIWSSGAEGRRRRRRWFDRGSR